MLVTPAASRFTCALCVLLLAGLVLAGCGDAASSTIVARVGKDTITKRNLERWTTIEAVLAYETDPKRPVPKGVVPDPPAYSDCIAYLTTIASAHGPARPASGQLKRQCEQKHKLLQRHILDILLTYYWLRADGAEKGVRVTSREVKRVLDGIFSTPAAFRRYQSITKESPADERLIIERDLLDTKLLQIAESKLRTRGPTSERQRARALIGLATAFTRKWSARTSCHAGYVVSECRQYRGKRSLVLP